MTFHVNRSSRRKEALLYLVGAPDQDELEPPYVGCYKLQNLESNIRRR